MFGYWPSFHDAEVVRLELVWLAPFAEGPDLLVSFRFRGVDQLWIEDWNNQNALMGLRIEDIRSRQLDVRKFEVCFDSVGMRRAVFVPKC